MDIPRLDGCSGTPGTRLGPENQNGRARRTCNRDVVTFRRRSSSCHTFGLETALAQAGQKFNSWPLMELVAHFSLLSRLVHLFQGPEIRQTSPKGVHHLMVPTKGFAAATTFDSSSDGEQEESKPTASTTSKRIKFARLQSCTEFLLSWFFPKLVLEVFGGAGAIWGFSEAVGLRRPDTIWFWRPASLCVGFVFLVRLILQLRLEHERHRQKQERQGKGRIIRQETQQLASSFDLELADESTGVVRANSC